MSHENKQMDIYAQVAAHHAKVGESAKPEDRIIGKAPELGMGFGEPGKFLEAPPPSEQVMVRRELLKGVLQEISDLLGVEKRLTLIEVPGALREMRETQRHQVGEECEVYTFGGFEGVKIDDAADMMNEIARLRAELEQAQATIAEMGGRIDSLVAEKTEVDDLLLDCKWRITNKVTSTEDYRRLDAPVVARIDALAARQ